MSVIHMENPTPYRQLLPPEEALLLISARREIPDKLLNAATDLIPKIDWDRFLQLTLEHGVGPLVYASMKRHFPSSVPEPCLVQLRQNALMNAQNNLALLRELLTTAQQLDSNGIKYAIFKGLIINQMVYQDMGIRKCGDIDLLVSKKDFPRAKAWFLSQGFTRTLTDIAEIQCMQSGLWNEQRRISIDLHWGIPPPELGIRAIKILNNLSEIGLGGKSLPTFSPEDLFIVMCVNATKEYWNQHLYPYCDIHEFLQDHGDLDWKHILKRASELKCERMLHAALGMVKELYETSLPAEVDKYSQPGSPTYMVVKELQQQLFELDTHNSTFVSQTRHLYFFHSTDDYFIALIDTWPRRFIYRHIYRHTRRFIPDETELAQISLPRSLSFLHYVIRPMQITSLLFQKVYRKLTGTS